MTLTFQNSKSKIFTVFLILNIICLLVIFIKDKSSLISNYWTYYYYFFLFNILVGLIVLIKNPRYEVKKIILLSYLAFYLSLLTFELVIYDKEKNNEKNKIKYQIAKKKKVNDFIEFSKKFKNLAIVTYPRDNFDYKQNFKIYPLSGISMSKTLFCDEGDGYSFYDSDRFGFNNKDEIWNEKEVDYFVLGDSTAHGACVSRKNNLISKLSTYSKKKFINLAYRGNGPLLEYATLKEYASETKFKTILLVISSVNDLNDLQSEKKITFLNKYLLQNNFKQFLPEKQKEIDLFLNKKIKKNIENIQKIKINYDYSLDLKKTILLGRSRNILYDIQRNMKNENKIKKQIYNNKEKQFKHVMQKFIDFSNKNKVNFQVILFWDWTLLGTNKKNSDHQLIKDSLDALNVNYIDVEQIIHNYKKNFQDLFPNGIINSTTGSNHFNIFGYDLIAKKIYKELK